ncbi:hypothetical protein [Cytobacillus sp. IB215665]|uniref:hypothetical protein n=1 Tax=Cytobacillus sp. IB215665 TaxID=3097357 RepID=UPI002A0C776E|nr:hypothetical protein [Cytobacillus sp. IB215665]MDX8367892.1 hypothetical protein [Cytobacillus sp. IB215665]
MSDYKLSKSVMERYDIRLDNWSCQWAIISISNDGVFNAQTDCGDFSYRWGSFGNCFKSFLIGVFSKDTHYLYKKIHDSNKTNLVDVEKTVNNMKERILQNRRENGSSTPYVMNELSPEEARELWDELDSIQSCHGEITGDAFASIFYHELPDTARRKEFGDEFWHEDILTYSTDRQAEAFCEVVAPIFAEILKEELAEKVAV